jgi:2-amino-4-hydroxy-6-hydroxymethyldihydropteridine diphosphokinase
MRMSTVYVALGSNLGDRLCALHGALSCLASLASLQATSALYQSQPMYVSDQPAFLNAACKLQTDLPPHQLINALKDIESNIGRQTSFRNGPRLIDLDIILYDNQLISTPTLQIPHPRMSERAFVLKPMCDIGAEVMHPIKQETMLELYNQLDVNSKKELQRVIPCYNHLRKQTRYILLDSGKPLIMGVVNSTPDRYAALCIILLQLHIRYL